MKTYPLNPLGLDDPRRCQAAICPSKPSSPRARSSCDCDRALGKGFTKTPVTSASADRCGELTMCKAVDVR